MFKTLLVVLLFTCSGLCWSQYVLQEYFNSPNCIGSAYQVKSFNTSASFNCTPGCATGSKSSVKTTCSNTPFSPPTEGFHVSTTYLDSNCTVSTGDFEANRSGCTTEYFGNMKLGRRAICDGINLFLISCSVDCSGSCFFPPGLGIPVICSAIPSPPGSQLYRMIDCTSTVTPINSSQPVNPAGSKPSVTSSSAAISVLFVAVVLLFVM